MEITRNAALYDPRLKEVIQTISDLTFAHMLKTASRHGVPVMESWPLDMVGGDIHTRLKEVIADALVALMPPAHPEVIPG